MKSEDEERLIMIRMETANTIAYLQDGHWPIALIRRCGQTAAVWVDGCPSASPDCQALDGLYPYGGKRSWESQWESRGLECLFLSTVYCA